MWGKRPVRSVDFIRFRAPRRRETACTRRKSSGIRGRWPGRSIRPPARDARTVVDCRGLRNGQQRALERGIADRVDLASERRRRQADGQRRGRAQTRRRNRLGQVPRVMSHRSMPARWHRMVIPAAMAPLASCSWRMSRWSSATGNTGSGWKASASSGSSRKPVSSSAPLWRSRAVRSSSPDPQMPRSGA